MHGVEPLLFANNDVVTTGLAFDSLVSVVPLLKVEPFGGEALRCLPLGLRAKLSPLHVVATFEFGYAQNPHVLLMESTLILSL